MTKLKENSITLLISLSVALTGGVASWWKTMHDYEIKIKGYMESNYTNKIETSYMAKTMEEIKISVKEMRVEQRELRDTVIRSMK